VFLYDSPTGDRIAIYLVDTQGLFDHLSTPTDNIRIFSLSALMSSVQLMNIFNVIQESDIEYLQVCVIVLQLKVFIFKIDYFSMRQKWLASPQSMTSQLSRSKSSFS
jgi:hypothetical protein